MNRLLPLTKGLYAIIDEADHDMLAAFRWHAHKGGKNWYAARVEYQRLPDGTRKRVRFYMHQVLCVGLTEGKPFADHRDGNTLNNQRFNLRPSNKSQNAANRPKDNLQNGTSRYKGVSYDKSRLKWAAAIQVNGKRMALGRFNDECDAAQAYN